MRSGVNRVVRSDDEHSNGGAGGDELDAPHDGPAAETATRCSFAPPPIVPPAPAAKSSGVGSCNHEASGSADNGDPSPPAEEEDDDDPFEAAARQIKRHCVHLVRAIGHDMAAEALRDDLPQRASNRAALADAIASRLASEVLGDA